MVDDIKIALVKSNVWFGLYPTTNTVHRVLIRPGNNGFGMSLCGKRFKPRVAMKTASPDHDHLCKFCERLAAIR